MIEIKILREDQILIVYPAANLHAVDSLGLNQLNLLVNPYVEERGGLQGIATDAGSFPGWPDFSSLLSHPHFLHNRHGQFERVAAVTDRGFIATLPEVGDRYVAAEVRHFNHQERDKTLSSLQACSI